jgi:fructose transport system ATP-binding protein
VSEALAPPKGEAVLTPLLEAANLSKIYGHVEAIRALSFTLLPGEIHAIVGDNGAGKSTFVRIISGAVSPTTGRLLIDGSVVKFRNPNDASAVGIATVYQNLALVGVRDIAANMFLGREPVTRLGFVRAGYMHRRATAIVRSLKQANIKDSYLPVIDLSGGQRQAVAIAREIQAGKRILVLDEPTAALGVRESSEVLSLIESLREPSRGIIIIAHNLDHVFRLADRITVMRGGRDVGTVIASESDHEDVVRLITGAVSPQAPARSSLASGTTNPE